MLQCPLSSTSQSVANSLTLTGCVSCVTNSLCWAMGLASVLSTSLSLWVTVRLPRTSPPMPLPTTPATPTITALTTISASRATSPMTTQFSTVQISWPLRCLRPPATHYYRMLWNLNSLACNVWYLTTTTLCTTKHPQSTSWASSTSQMTCIRPS